MLPHGHNFTTYIDASYARWVEAGGARVVPVMVDRNSEQYFMEVRNKIRHPDLVIFSQSVSLTQYVVLFFCPPVCLSQLASGEFSLTILTLTIVGEYRRVF